MYLKKFCSYLWSFLFLMMVSFAVWGFEEKLQDIAKWTGIPGELQIYLLSFFPTPDPYQTRSFFREWLHCPNDEQILKHGVNTAFATIHKISSGLKDSCAYFLQLLKDNAVAFSGMCSVVSWKQANKKPPSPNLVG